MANISQNEEIDIEILPHKRSVTEKLLSAFLAGNSSEGDEDAQINLLTLFTTNILMQMQTKIDQWFFKNSNIRSQALLNHSS